MQWYLCLLKTYIIEIELSDNVVIMFNIKNMLLSRGTAFDAHGEVEFDFNNLEVKVEPVTQGSIFYYRNG